jgi:hypothetical protein
METKGQKVQRAHPEPTQAASSKARNEDTWKQNQTLNPRASGLQTFVHLNSLIFQAVCDEN